METNSTLTHLARPIDLRYPSNRFAVTAAAAATVAGWFATSDPGDAIVLGVAAFLAWAIGRELDPDDPAAAAVAAVLTGFVGAAALAIGAVRPSLGATFALLLATRIVVRSTGRPPTPLDLVALVGIAAFVARDLVGWTAAMVLAFGLAWDRRLPASAPWTETVAAFIVAACATVRLALTAPTEPVLAAGPAWGWILLAAGSILAAPTLRPEIATAPGDLTGEPLDGRRILAARALAIAALVATALVAGAGAGPALLPVIAALVGGGLRHLRRRSHPDGPRLTPGR